MPADADECNMCRDKNNGKIASWPDRDDANWDTKKSNNIIIKCRDRTLYGVDMNMAEKVQ